MKLKDNPYNDSMQMLAIYAPNELVGLVNEIFGETYTRDAIVTPRPTEWPAFLPDESTSTDPMDMRFSISEGDATREYRIVVQTTDDDLAAYRILKNDVIIANEQAYIEGHHLVVTMPKSALIKLWPCSLENRIDDICLRLHFSDSASDDHIIPVVSVCDHTIDELFSEDVLFLVPFYMFRHAPAGNHELTSAERKCIITELKLIRSRLEDAAKRGQIDEVEKGLQMVATNTVTQHLFEKDEKICKEADILFEEQLLDGTREIGVRDLRLRFVPQSDVFLHNERLGRAWRREGMLVTSDAIEIREDAIRDTLASAAWNIVRYMRDKKEDTKTILEALMDILSLTSVEATAAIVTYDDDHA